MKNMKLYIAGILLICATSFACDDEDDDGEYFNEGVIENYTELSERGCN